MYLYIYVRFLRFVTKKQRSFSASLFCTNILFTFLLIIANQKLEYSQIIYRIWVYIKKYSNLC